ncbi:hypothetical protein FGO68_gene14318 [Halteria grandinella]|uniref:Cyclic nucleotide-binding domain-containing protein n=1 Tax=Halteria grandinella TaxID=5974 RepID=A0A8J8NCP8_HALGN|nr:hypothetical protein FGO68_gene14318 [Halteria grandinella]
MLIEFRTVTAENADHVGLTKFIGLLKRFNKGHPLPQELVRKMEGYFDYYWQQDLNYAMKSDEDQRFISELPKEIRINIYKNFLFAELLYKFKGYFNIPRNPQERIGSKKWSKYYTWGDKVYSSFMIKLLQHLEPRQFKKKDVIFRDLEEVDEILFVVKGEFAIGYTVNNQEYLALKMKERNVIGDISIMFRRRSEFLYRALSRIDCQAIRKHMFYEILDKYKEFGMRLKARAFYQYKDIIRRPVLEHKKATYDHIFRLHPDEKPVGTQAVIDPSMDDENMIKREFEESTPESQTNLKKLFKIDEKIERMHNNVNSICKRHDEIVDMLVTELIRVSAGSTANSVSTKSGSN